MIIRECLECNEEMKKIKTEAKAGWGDYEVIIKGIDAYACPKCDDKVFDYQTTQMLQELGKSLSLTNDLTPDILNVEEVSDLLRVSKQTVYNMIKDSRLKAVKIGREWRFMKKDIESVLNEDSIHLAARGDSNKKDLAIIKQALEQM